MKWKTSLRASKLHLFEPCPPNDQPTRLKSKTELVEIWNRVIIGSNLALRWNTPWDHYIFNLSWLTKWVKLSSESNRFSKENSQQQKSSTVFERLWLQKCIKDGGYGSWYLENLFCTFVFRSFFGRFLFANQANIPLLNIWWCILYLYFLSILYFCLYLYLYFNFVFCFQKLFARSCLSTRLSYATTGISRIYVHAFCICICIRICILYFCTFVLLFSEDFLLVLIWQQCQSATIGTAREYAADAFCICFFLCFLSVFCTFVFQNLANDIFTI